MQQPIASSYLYINLDKSKLYLDRAGGCEASNLLAPLDHRHQGADDERGTHGRQGAVAGGRVGGWDWRYWGLCALLLACMGGLCVGSWAKACRVADLRCWEATHAFAAATSLAVLMLTACSDLAGAASKQASCA